MASASSTTDPNQKLKILMIHGFTQTGHLFEIKSKALKKALEKSIPPAPKPGHLKQYPGGLEFHYPTGPIKLEAASIPGSDPDDDANIEAYGWWRRKGEEGKPFHYEGIESGFQRIAEVLEAEGPFAGVIGFSQGGAAAGMVAALLESGRKEAFERAQSEGAMQYPDSFAQETFHPPLKFGVSYSGFAPATNPLYQAFYQPKIQTPMLHFLGTVDTVVSEERSLRLVEACTDGKGVEGGMPRVVYHPGGHFLPSSQKQYVAALVSFIREAVGENGNASVSNGQEERVEDMDVPF